MPSNINIVFTKTYLTAFFQVVCFVFLFCPECYGQSFRKIVIVNAIKKELASISCPAEEKLYYKFDAVGLIVTTLDEENRRFNNFGINLSDIFECKDTISTTENEQNKLDSALKLHLFRLKLESIQIESSNIDIVLDNTTLGSVLIAGRGKSLKKGMMDLVIVDSRIGSLSLFEESLAATIPERGNPIITGNCWFLLTTTIDVISISNCSVYNSFSLSGFIPKQISLYHVKFESENANLDLSELVIPPDKSCDLAITDCDLSKINLNYACFSLSINDKRPEYIEYQYNQMIERQQKLNNQNGIKKAVIEYKQYEYTKNKDMWGSFVNIIDKYWWNYGYNKEYIFTHTLEYILLFFFINLLIYPALLAHGYEMTHFELANKKLQQKKYWFTRKIYSTIYCFLYTNYIFWGLKLDFDKIRITKLSITVFLIFQYLVGVVCLGFIANAVFVK